MKKLLSLLSVLTISGSAVPTTIAASHYQKEGTIKNSDINLQINNLENLNRDKRKVGQGSWNNNELFSQEEYNLNFKKVNLSSQLNRVKRGTLEEKISWQNEQINYFLSETKKINNKLKEMGKSSKIAIATAVGSAVTCAVATGTDILTTYFAQTALVSTVATVIGGTLISAAIQVFGVISAICAIISAIAAAN